MNRFDIFRSNLNNIRTHYQAERGDSPSVSFHEIMQLINSGSHAPFSAAEVLKQIQLMSDANMSVWWQPEQETLLFF